MHFSPTNNKARWLAYFDLLGIRDLLANGKELQVFHAYERALEELERNQNRTTLRHTWFSDTFLIVAPDDSGPVFTQIEQISRLFVCFLLQVRIPLRGAISCGKVYSDFSKNIIFGQGLVEAYQYGDGQDWIGLLLSPSAVGQLAALGLPAENLLNYAFVDVPWKREPNGAPVRLPACILGRWGQIKGRNLCLDSLRAMAVQHAVGPIRDKYDRAIGFIEANERKPVLNS